MALSEQEVLTRLFELENGEEADRRARLRGERYLALFLDKLEGKSYVFLHGLQQSDGMTTDDAEFYEFERPGQAEGTFERMLDEFRESGQLLDEDSLEDLGDPKTDGADPGDMEGLRDNTDDPLIVPEP